MRKRADGRPPQQHRRYVRHEVRQHEHRAAHHRGVPQPRPVQVVERQPRTGDDERRLLHAARHDEERGKEEQQRPIHSRNDLRRVTAGGDDEYRRATKGDQRQRQADEPPDDARDEYSARKQRESAMELARHRYLGRSISRRPSRHAISRSDLRREIPAERDREHRIHDHQPAQRRRCEGNEKWPEPDAACQADDHVLRIPRDRHRAANVGCQCNREEIWQRPIAQPLHGDEHQRREDDAHRVIHHECRCNAAHKHHGAEQQSWRSRACHGRSRKPFESAGHLQVAHEQQHAKQEGQDVEIHRGVCLCEWQSADRDHRHRANERGRGTRQANADACAQLRKRDEEVRDGEHDQPAHVNVVHGAPSTSTITSFIKCVLDPVLLRAITLGSLSGCSGRAGTREAATRARPRSTAPRPRAASSGIPRRSEAPCSTPVPCSPCSAAPP